MWMRMGCYLTISVQCVYFAYLIALCGTSVLLVCISTSSLRMARWHLLGGGGAEGSARRGDAFIPGLVLTAAAKVRGKSNKRICIYMENRDQMYRMPLCLVHCLKLVCNVLEGEGTLRPPILLPSLEMIFFLQCHGHCYLKTNLCKTYIVCNGSVWKHSKSLAFL